MRVKLTEDKARLIKEGIQDLVDKHGLDAIRLIWNKMAKGLRLKKQLLAEQKRVNDALSKLKL